MSILGIIHILGIIGIIGILGIIREFEKCVHNGYNRYNPYITYNPYIRYNPYNPRKFKKGHSAFSPPTKVKKRVIRRRIRRKVHF